MRDLITAPSVQTLRLKGSSAAEDPVGPRISASTGYAVSRRLIKGADHFERSYDRENCRASRAFVGGPPRAGAPLEGELRLLRFLVEATRQSFIAWQRRLRPAGFESDHRDGRSSFEAKLAARPYRMI